jgi:diguanylate cyclase (GGDEF)-like protein/PAS domain S-box-containing protein
MLDLRADQRYRMSTVRATGTESRRGIGGLLAQVAGLACITDGLNVLIGWHLHLVALVRPFGIDLPLPYDAALGIVAAGLGLVAVARDRQRLGVIAGTAAAFLGVMGGVEHITRRNFGLDVLISRGWLVRGAWAPGRMTLNVALGLFLAGAGLIVLWLPGILRTRIAMGAVLGSLCAAIGGVGLFGYASGVPTAHGWGQLVQMPPHAAASLATLGAGLIAAAWHRQDRSASARWLATPVGIGALLLLLLSGWALAAIWPAGSGVLGAREGTTLLTLGILIAGLAGLAFRIGQVAWTRNRILQAEVEERRQAEELVSISEERFRNAFAHAPIGMALVSLEPMPHGTFVQVNGELCRMLGYTEAQLVSRQVESVIHPRDAFTVEVRASQLCSGAISSYQVEARYLHADGHEVWVAVSSSLVHDREGEPGWVINQFQDITERKKISERLTHMALHDPLTGLANRALFDANLEQALARAKRSGTPPAAMLLDLDGFKRINDSLGHLAGDELLRDVGERLRSSMRPSDTVARLGGDEFIVLCEDLSTPEDVESVAGRLNDVLRAPFELRGRRAVVTSSIGVAQARLGDTSESLISRTDQAMYEAKGRGKARYEMFSEHPAGQTYLDIENGLRIALEKDQLEVFYQPQVRLADGAVTGVEALVRWRHPTRGLLIPKDFISVAEETRLIVPIGAFVLERACQEMQRWQRERPGHPQLRLSINVAMNQLGQEFVEHVDRVLRESSMPADRLCLEITETALARVGGAESAALAALKERGVALAIDDFGTAYASVEHLRRFPVDELKIDRTFVSGISDQPTSERMASALVSFGLMLGLGVVAEGVESAAQARHLQDAGCPTAQGFYFARPAPIDLLEASPVASTAPSTA